MNCIIILLVIIIILYLVNNYNNQEHFENNKFKNVILLVVFNFANCVHNMNNIKLLYQKHFKDIIFYSDIPEDNKTEINLEVNYLPIKQGYHTHKLFKHFNNKYKYLINESDGLFYTMDDNIINVKELDNFTTDKIIFYYNKQNVHDIKTTRNLDAWWRWKDNILIMDKISEDPIFKKYNFDNYNFSWDFSDWFYLPKKYLNYKLFDLFELFGKYELFIEIAIPSAIFMINNNENDYQKFNDLVLWYGGEREYVKNKDYVYKALKEDKKFIIHPIKFNSNTEALIWLDNIFNN
jgi:hypothetical protein